MFDNTMYKEDRNEEMAVLQGRLVEGNIELDIVRYITLKKEMMHV